jgi:two-component system, LytTR family, sensor kinase
MKTKYKVLVHIIYWIYIINQTWALYFLSSVPLKPDYYIDLFWGTFLNMFSFYSVYFCLPYLFKNKNIFLSVLLSILLVIINTGIRLPVDFEFEKYIMALPEKELVIQFSWILNEFRAVIVTGIYAVLIHFTIKLFETQKLKADLITQNQASELALLRSQINPHFLFNTLNNIYSLVYKKSDDAPEAVMKLSSIMRYTLYDSVTDQVLLEKEVEYLKSFIELQQLRFKKNDFVEFNISGNLEGHTIAPMLFISFVENAFKHGSKKVESPGIIVDLKVTEGKIIFEVMNYFKANDVSNVDITGGIGLQNIRRRLELLYKEKHQLEISKTEDKYIVKLEIDNK